MPVVSHLTSNKHRGVDINDLTSRLGVGRAADLIILEATTQQGVRRSEFSLGGRLLISRHNRLHYKRLRDQFYSETTYVRPKFQSLHGESFFQLSSTKYHFTRDETKAGDTKYHVGNTLMLFTHQVGVPDELVTKNYQNVSESGTKWAQIYHEKDIYHILTDTYSHWENANEGSQRDILQIYKKKRVQKGVPKQLFL